MTIETALICIFAAFAIVALIGLYMMMLNQIKDARAQARELEERVRELEFANNYRMSYKTTREIENAQGTNSRAIEIAETLMEFLNNTQFHLTLAHNPDEKKNSKSK